VLAGAVEKILVALPQRKGVNSYLTEVHRRDEDPGDPDLAQILAELGWQFEPALVVHARLGDGMGRFHPSFRRFWVSLVHSESLPPTLGHLINVNLTSKVLQGVF
jgi:hypothetical protein